jgi:hypothetical protein
MVSIVPLTFSKSNPPVRNAGAHSISVGLNPARASQKSSVGISNRRGARTNSLLRFGSRARRYERSVEHVERLHRKLALRRRDPGRR